MIVAHWFQDAAVNATFDYFGSGNTGAALIALPTGTGKSVCIAKIVERVLFNAPTVRILIATHSKELVKQNAKRMLEVWPTAPVGINSAGLGQRDVAHPILFAGIQSIYKNIEKVGKRDILIIDEAHLVSPEGETRYQKAIAELKIACPQLAVVGLTATTYRMGQGSLTNEGGIFTDVVFDMTDLKGFNRLIDEGFICPIYPKKTATELDVSRVKLSNGDYAKGDLQQAVNKRDLTERILEETLHEGAGRNHGLIFCAGNEHADTVAELLSNKYGVPSVSIHSGITNAERDKRLASFHSGESRFACNNNVLTTGYDFPAIDLIVMLRPTVSPGLWVQMCGRGTRTSHETGKRDCLVLDFAGNTRRLGPINDPIKPRRKGEGPAGDAPVRICPSCGTYNHASARQCFFCGQEFAFNPKLTGVASTDELIRTEAPDIRSFKVNEIIYNRHLSTKNPNAKPCVKVQYLCGLRSFNEWVHFDVTGAPGHQAREWFRKRAPIEPPTPETCLPYPSATDAALSLIQNFRKPKAIRVWVNKPYPEITEVEF